MKVRLLSAMAALVLAIIGGVLIASYVQGADQRALAGTVTRSVLVVTKSIAAGTPVAQLGDSLQLKAIPATAIAPGALDSLTGATDTITAVELLPGEQLLRARLVEKSTLLSPGTVAVPAGLQEVTVLLGPDRTVGASIRAGQTVGLFISFPATGPVPAVTRLAFQKLLVTNVQGAPAQAAPTTPGDAVAPTAAPTGSMLITFAVSAEDAEKIVFSTQFGTIWLSSETPDTATTVPGGATQENVFR